MATATLTPSVTDDTNDDTETSAYDELVAKIKAYVLDNQPRPSTRGLDLTKAEKTELAKFQRELVKNLSDADKTAFRDREAKARADRKANAKPQPIRLDPSWLTELAAQVRELKQSFKEKRKPVIAGVEMTNSSVFDLIAGAIETVVANPPKSTRQIAPGEDSPHTVIRLRTDGSGEPFGYGKYSDKSKAERSAKAFAKRLEAIGADVAGEFEFKVLSVEEAEQAGYPVPEKTAA